MLRGKIERKKTQEKDKKVIIKRMSTIFNIKTNQNQMERDETKKRKTI
jgi:hypothetical protein